MYALLIWTVVGIGSTQFGTHDWRLLVETHPVHHNGYHTAKEVCEDVAKELGLKQTMYRCVRTK